MNEKHDAEIGQTVYLRPGTKTAPRECYLGLAVKLVSVAKWPMVAVWVIATNKEISTHRLNVVLHPPGWTAKEKEGDGVNQAASAKAKPAFRPHKPLSDGDWEEPVLF